MYVYMYNRICAHVYHVYAQVSCIPRGHLGACERCLHSEQCSTGMQLEVGQPREQWEKSKENHGKMEVYQVGICLYVYYVYVRRCKE